MNSRSLLFAAALTIAAVLPASAQRHRLHIVTTGDIHGSFFSEDYVTGKATTSLMSVKNYVDYLRSGAGKDNVLLLDAGDILQGDNAAFYYNYVTPRKVHLYSRMAAYMGYDAVAFGNHDIETGHAVYDKVAAELQRRHVPVLAGNVVNEVDRKPYFPVSAIVYKAGLKVAVLGFDNPNIKAWLSEELWKGLDFENLIPYVQNCVDEVIAAESPELVVVLVHSGTGEGDGSVLESQAMDLYKSLKGVDVLVGAHDHRQMSAKDGNMVYVNGGARCGYVGHVMAEVYKENGKVSEKVLEPELVRLDKALIDHRMKKRFAKDFDRVQKFTLKKVGTLDMPLLSREAYSGMCDYLNLVHTVQVSVPEAQISFAAPLTFNGSVKAGDVIFNDLFTIYPFENQLFVMKMKGSEIKNYLEYSYDSWIQTPGEHLLRIRTGADPRTGAERASFVGRSYNFDSAAGLVYTVDVTRPAGERVSISSLADGKPFDPEGWYNVAMTSYRANGGGDLVIKGAGIPKEDIDSRVVARYPEIRNMIHDFFLKHGTVDHDLVSDPAVIGHWEFTPDGTVAPLMESDLYLLFGRR